ncbi:hypothetical protein [Natronoglycomyces albus]|uniref:Uncharacterized protein n=1 Tax=Natronoglycomyces albus TaxID=2811108 RepID=A0A895XHD2_9ACTN|nr:hypothetical protein [Natronoglycomyces albus]QSB04337.1 hypothetical protein JQS30_11080 [Natronoglycomyces albus]
MLAITFDPKQIVSKSAYFAVVAEIVTTAAEFVCSQSGGVIFHTDFERLVLRNLDGTIRIETNLSDPEGFNYQVRHLNQGALDHQLDNCRAAVAHHPRTRIPSLGSRQ